MPDQVHQVGGVLAVVNGKAGIEADLFGIVAQEPRADAVKGAGPGERAGHDAGIRSKHLRANPIDAPGHFGRGAAREGHQQNTARVGAIDDKVRDAVGERVGLARTRSGNDKKRHGRRAGVFPNAVFDRPSLF